MVKHIIGLLIVIFLVTSCSLVNNVTTGNPTSPILVAPSATASVSNPTEVSTSTVAPAATETPAATPTSSIPSGAVVVNTFDQEVFPFKQDGNCSLGEAIWAVQTHKDQDGCVVAAGSSTIYMPMGTYTLTDPDTSSPPMPGAEGRLGFDPGGFPVIYTAVTILGNGSTIQRMGPNKFGIFQLTAQADLTLNDLTISGGDNSNVDLSNGGAIEIQLGQTTLNHVIVTGNQSYDGGGISNSTGTLTLNDSVVRGNTAAFSGGGIYNSGLGACDQCGGNLGGGIVIVKNSIISSNVVEGEDNNDGGIYNDAGTVTLDHSQLVSNQAAEGGGIYNDSGKLNIIDQSVVSGNVATEVSDIPHGGGGINSLGVGGDALVTLRDSFIIGNQAPKSVAGGIYVQGPESNSTVLKITNSVLADNSALASGGILIDFAGTGSITGSCIVENKATKVPGNVGGDIDNGNTDQVPFAASNNWWGASSGSGSVSQFVTTAPVLTSPPAICAGAIPTSYPTPSGK